MEQDFDAFMANTTDSVHFKENRVKSTREGHKRDVPMVHITGAIPAMQAEKEEAVTKRHPNLHESIVGTPESLRAAHDRLQQVLRRTDTTVPSAETIDKLMATVSTWTFDLFLEDSVATQVEGDKGNPAELGAPFKPELRALPLSERDDFDASPEDSSGVNAT